MYCLRTMQLDRWSGVSPNILVLMLVKGTTVRDSQWFGWNSRAAVVKMTINRRCSNIGGSRVFSDDKSRPDSAVEVYYDRCCITMRFDEILMLCKEDSERDKARKRETKRENERKRKRESEKDKKREREKERKK